MPRPHPDAPTRTALTKARLIPTCYATIWTTPPSPDHPGTAKPCRARAAYQLTRARATAPTPGAAFGEGISTEHLTTKTCRAHIAEELDRADRDREFAQYMYRITLPAPTLTELHIALDTRAAAHGKTRIWLTTHPQPTNRPIPLELFGTNPLLLTPHRTHHQPRPRPEPPHQHTLFDKPHTPQRHYLPRY